MRLAKRIFVVASILLTLQSVIHAKEWRGIVPLHSTRADVERLFGSKVVRCGNSSCIYDLNEEILFVLYATNSDCKNDDDTSAWKVPVNTVIELRVAFKKDRPLSELGFDLSKFERVEDNHLPGWIYYLNLEEGVRIEGGLVTASGVTYFHSAKDYSLRCPSDKRQSQGKPAPKPSTNDEALKCQAEPGAHGTGSFKFDEYGAISEDGEKTKLDRLAAHLRLSDWLGFIITYEGPSTSNKAAYARGERAKAYLMQTGVDGKRVFVIDGGRREELTIELFTTKPGTLPPSPRPTIP